MKRAVIYARVSTGDQHPESQIHDLRAMAAQRGYQIQHEYRDVISGAKARRPGLDQLLADARKHRFDVVLVWAFDRLARSVRHFLEVLDELNHLQIEFISFRENIDSAADREHRHRQDQEKQDALLRSIRQDLDSLQREQQRLATRPQS
jgi:DNA invertase Pin-like site-specific DNA recombinase